MVEGSEFEFLFAGWEVISCTCSPPPDTPLWQLVVRVSCWAATSIAFNFTDACEPTHPPQCLYAFSKGEVALRGHCSDYVLFFFSFELSFHVLFSNIFVTPLLSVYHLFGVPYIVCRSA